MKIAFGLITKFKAHPGNRKALVNILLEAATGLDKYNACIQYVVSVNEEDPDTVIVSEVWTDEGHHAASLDNEEVKAVIERAKPLIHSIEKSVKMDVVGGKGL
ncbi:antibiotic biosynthesis monooxygenase [Listeria booriae]|uniref:Monooxygenase n=1 Tax=Listeria booriae TaxID=1552123 RepID=A0A099W401_9LIST|nr:putative quinol monooxygenase [Listeria booriae]KGL40474.1 monooxygenase [Listeria booriae]MBC1229313.1 antibiotic biosynthesis monooxygenase [Listeria booriae]MBC1291052.1 antibiotic biosynthesis monooxygenase [Listeria booriae]MBC1334029.1 antibiotic biosynthesis monooxygenase [Listeria booriae]MBC1356979.1 antibiotic biosynthesis monooxygenase [Listeria booriae]